MTAHRDRARLRRIESLLRRRTEGLARIDLRWERKDQVFRDHGDGTAGYTDWLVPAGTPLTRNAFGVTTVPGRQHGDGQFFHIRTP